MKSQAIKIKAKNELVTPPCKYPPESNLEGLTLPLWHQGTKKGKKQLHAPRVGISPAGRKIRWSAGVGWSVRRRLDLKPI